MLHHNLLSAHPNLPKYVVCQVDGRTQKYYEGTKREFFDREKALEFLFASFANMYGEKAQVDYKFWDPVNKDDSTELYSIEIFPTNEDDGWYLVREWETFH